MAERSPKDDNLFSPYNEKDTVPDHAPDIADGRRKSVALNIIENPLKVSFAA